MNIYFNNLTEWLNVHNVLDISTPFYGVYMLIDGSMYVLGYNIETETFSETPVKLNSFTENIQSMDVVLSDDVSFLSFINYGPSDSLDATETPVIKKQPKIYFKIDGEYKQVSSTYVKVNGEYISANRAYVKTIDGWRAAQPTPVTPPITGPYLWVRVDCGAMYLKQSGYYEGLFYNVSAWHFDYLEFGGLSTSKIVDLMSVDFNNETLLTHWERELGKPYLFVPDEFVRWGDEIYNFAYVDVDWYYREYEDGDEDIDFVASSLFKFYTPQNVAYAYFIISDIYMHLNKEQVLEGSSKLKGDVYVSNNSTNGQDGDWFLIKKNLFADYFPTNELQSICILEVSIDDLANTRTLYINTVLPLNHVFENTYFSYFPFIDMGTEGEYYKKKNIVHKIIASQEKIEPNTSWENIKNMQIIDINQDEFFYWSDTFVELNVENFFNLDSPSAYGDLLCIREDAALSFEVVFNNFVNYKYIYILATIPEDFVGNGWEYISIYHSDFPMGRVMNQFFTKNVTGNVFIEIPVDFSYTTEFEYLPIREDYPIDIN